VYHLSLTTRHLSVNLASQAVDAEGIVRIESFVFTCSSIAAATLLMSAAWKVVHPRQFTRAFRARAGRRFEHLDGVAAGAVPLVEALAAVGLLAQGTLGRYTVAPAAGLLVGFTLVALLTASTGGGCGCWRESPDLDPRTERVLLLVRNGVLVLSVVPALAAPASLAALPSVALFVVGSVFALLLLELPEFSLVVESQKGLLRS
jgi:hypothetical protein